VVHQATLWLLSKHVIQNNNTNRWAWALQMYEIDDPISSKGILNCCLCLYNLLFKSYHVAPPIVVTTTLFCASLTQKLYHWNSFGFNSSSLGLLLLYSHFLRKIFGCHSVHYCRKFHNLKGGYYWEAKDNNIGLSLVDPPTPAWCKLVLSIHSF
jgi:hypothetical protein